MAGGEVSAAGSSAADAVERYRDAAEVVYDYESQPSDDGPADDGSATDSHAPAIPRNADEAAYFAQQEAPHTSTTQNIVRNTVTMVASTAGGIAVGVACLANPATAGVANWCAGGGAAAVGVPVNIAIQLIQSGQVDWAEVGSVGATNFAMGALGGAAAVATTAKVAAMTAANGGTKTLAAVMLPVGARLAVNGVGGGVVEAGVTFAATDGDVERTLQWPLDLMAKVS